MRRRELLERKFRSLRALPWSEISWLLPVWHMIGLSAAAIARMKQHLETKYGISSAGMEVAETASSRKLPLLVVHDERDARVPLELGRALVDAWPRAELHTTSGLGHQRVLKDVAVVDKLVRFVAGETS